MAVKKNDTKDAPAKGPVTTYDPTAGYSATSGYVMPQGASDPTTGISAPPPRDTNPFVNAQFLWAFGKPVEGTILGIKPAVGGNSEFGNRKGWFLVIQLKPDEAAKVAAGTMCNARVNEGDSRHAKLYTSFGANWIGQKIRLRLPHVGDQTKAGWTVDPL